MWTRISGAIVDGGQKVDCLPITDLIHFVLTKKVGNNKSPLAIMQPTVPLAYRDLLRHRHHMLTRHLPGLDPSFHRVKGLLIATHITEVTVELRQYK